MKKVIPEPKIYIGDLSNVPDVINVDGQDYFKYFFIHKSGNELNKEISINLNSPKAKVFLKGAIYLSKNSVCKLKINVTHNKGNNKCRVNIKSVLKDFSKFDFEGMIKITPKAHLSNSYLKQDNLVVSENATCNTSPQLEIKADNVKASHGATVGGFNEEEIFYLKSRGISEIECKNLLEEAFLASVFGKNLNLVLKEFKINAVIS